jgi:hypothetical protein
MKWAVRFVHSVRLGYASFSKPSAWKFGVFVCIGWDASTANSSSKELSLVWNVYRSLMMYISPLRLRRTPLQQEGEECKSGV